MTRTTTWPPEKGGRRLDQLTRALLDLGKQGIRTRCQNPTTNHLWLSEDQYERDLARQLCGGCPIMRACFNSAVGSHATWGVYGGHDFSVTPPQSQQD
jgi:hypothetical protein